MFYYARLQQYSVGCAASDYILPVVFFRIRKKKHKLRMLIPTPKKNADGSHLSDNAPNTRFVPTATQFIIMELMLSAVARCTVFIRLFCSSVWNGWNSVSETRSVKTARTEKNPFCVSASTRHDTAGSPQKSNKDRVIPIRPVTPEESVPDIPAVAAIM